MLQLGTLAPASSSSCLKRKPSEVIAAARQPGGLTAPSRSQLDNMTCRIVSFQDMGDYTHQVDSVVPVEEPLFKATPPEIRFANFESLQNLDATLCLRNQDNVARRVKILQPDSTFFKVLPGKGRKINGDGDNKVAPGMEVSYTVRFTPDQQVEDYSYDLVVVTERERFIVPIRATGCSALLDMPDELDFGVSPVKFESPKTIMVRNVGEKATKFLLKVPPPFSTSIQDGYLEVGEIMQVDVVFRPDKAEQYERDLLILYGDGIEAYMALKGKAENVSVTFSANQLQMEDTFIALSTQKTIVIHNNSEIPVDFSWRAFPSIQEEIGQKLKLQVQLKQEESDEAAALQELSSMGEDSDEESQLSESSDEYMTKCSSQGAWLKGVELAHGALQRRYKNIAKAILEDPMFFYDEIFAVEPLSGRIWAKSKVAITFTFTPKAALNYQCLAYCSIVGRAERLPLLLKGIGIGPKAAFSYDELDVGDIFVESVHQYEVNLINQGDIDVEFRLVPNNSPFGSKFAFTPSDGRLEVGGQCTIVVEVCPDLLGEFQETFYWELVGSTSKIALGFRGHSVSPTFHFDLDRISFGVVSYGFLNSKTLTLTNTSEVPMRFALRIPGDGRSNQREFDVIPPKGTLLPNCSQKIQIDFVSLNVKSYDLCLVVDLDGVGQELASIPIQARCAVPQVALEPSEHLEYGDIFIRYPSHQTLVLNNTSALPAKFQIMPQDDSTRSIAEFEPDQSFGSVPPASSHVLTFTLTSQVIGTLQIPITIRILGHNSANTVILIANTIGPIVNIEPSVVDWGNSHCLEPITRSVLVSNNSVIPASVRCIMKTRNSLWTLSPKAMELQPHESAYLYMTLTIDEVAKMTDIAHVIVHESNDVAVTVRAKGIGTPVTCKESLELIDFGTQYTTQTHSREVVIENRGRQPRKLVWTLELLG
ncbi:HYDIN [Symbiodinium sp. CCMP2456]|nr:HYDIN [Symbiodinium sp. CCMP2456]